MLRRYGASARSARARRTHDRIMAGDPRYGLRLRRRLPRPDAIHSARRRVQPPSGTHLAVGGATRASSEDRITSAPAISDLRGRSRPLLPMRVSRIYHPTQHTFNSVSECARGIRLISALAFATSSRSNASHLAMATATLTPSGGTPGNWYHFAARGAMTKGKRSTLTARRRGWLSIGPAQL